MGEIIQFPTHRIIKPTFPEEVFWRLIDLQNRRPHGHPEVKRGPRGGVIVEKEQVWVEDHTTFLWVVTYIKKGVHAGTLKHRIWLRPYKMERGFLRSFSEQTLLGSMNVWEDAVISRKELAKRFDPQWLAYFGLDKDGNRID